MECYCTKNYKKPKPDRPRDECGIFAVYHHEDAAKLTYFGLYAQQHRGQECAGIVVSDGYCVLEHKAMGLVPDIFDDKTLDSLKGDIALGHVRYSTTGSSVIANAQPFRIRHAGKCLAIAHNGNLVNAHSIRRELEDNGSIFQTSMDSEIVLHLVAKSLKEAWHPPCLLLQSNLNPSFLASLVRFCDCFFTSFMRYEESPSCVCSRSSSS